MGKKNGRNCFGWMQFLLFLPIFSSINNKNVAKLKKTNSTAVIKKMKNENKKKNSVKSSKKKKKALDICKK